MTAFMNFHDENKVRKIYSQAILQRFLEFGANLRSHSDPSNSILQRAPKMAVKSSATDAQTTYTKFTRDQTIIITEICQDTGYITSIFRFSG